MKVPSYFQHTTRLFLAGCFPGNHEEIVKMERRGTHSTKGEITEEECRGLYE